MSKLTAKQLLAGTPPQRIGEWNWRILPGHEPAVAELRALDWLAPQRFPGARPIKVGAGRGVWRLPVGDGTVVAKIFAPPTGWQRFKERIWGPAAQREFVAALYGLRRELSLVRPMACGAPADRRGPAPWVLLTEEVQDAVSLAAFWRGGSDDHGRRRRQIDNRAICDLARFLSTVHGGGLLPADLHPDNILVTPDQQYVLVDLHNARINISPREILRILNLADLHQWFRRHASRTDRLRFLLAYLTCAFEKPGEVLIRRYVREVSDATEWKRERLERKRDKRIFGDNKFFGVLTLPDGWTAHVFLQAQRPLLNSPCSRLRFDKSDWARALPEVLADGNPSVSSLTLGSHVIPVMVDRPEDDADVMRRRWQQAHRCINRHQAVPLPLALLEQTRDDRPARVIYIEEARGDRVEGSRAGERRRQTGGRRADESGRDASETAAR